jgi:hypothetical protein
MNLLLDDITIKIPQHNECDLIDAWAWLIKDIKQILLISKMGDMFFSANSGYIHWLATDDGTLTKIADNQAEFEQLLKDDANIDNWFLPLLIEKLMIAGKLLKYNEVYSFKKLPVIGGEYAIDNLEPTDISVHFTLTGFIHEQIKDLPDGTKIRLSVVE